MTHRAAALGAVLLVAIPVGLTAQGHELGGQAVVVAADPGTITGGPVVAWRPGRGLRLVGHAGLGGSSGELAFRGEVQFQLLALPERLQGVGAYVGGGVALAAGPEDAGRLLLTLGLEGSPGGRAGWMLELGVGGGARVALGYRWRRLPWWVGRRP